MSKSPEIDFVMDESDVCPSLPSIVRSKSGIAFDPNRPAWSYRDGVHSVYMDFSGLHFSAVLTASVHLTLIWFAENRAPSTLMGHFMALKAFALGCSDQLVVQPRQVAIFQAPTASLDEK